MTDTILDRAALKRLLNVIGGDLEDFDEIKQEFLETSPDLIADLKNAAANGDVDAMRIASHSLKGNARDFGANGLAEASEQLEHACKDAAAMSDAAALVTSVVQAEAATRQALAELKAADLG